MDQHFDDKESNEMEVVTAGPGTTVMIPEPRQEPEFVPSSDPPEIGRPRAQDISIREGLKLRISMCSVVSNAIGEVIGERASSPRLGGQFAVPRDHPAVREPCWFLDRDEFKRSVGKNGAPEPTAPGISSIHADIGHIKLHCQPTDGRSRAGPTRCRDRAIWSELNSLPVDAGG